MSRDQPAFVRREHVPIEKIDGVPVEANWSQAADRTTRSGKKLAFRRFHDPKTIVELLDAEDFYRLLGRSLVFIQNTANSSDYLVETLARLCSEVFSFRFIQTHSVSLETLLAELREGTQVAEKPQVWIVDTTKVGEDVGGFGREIAMLSNQHPGIWIRGYIRDLHPKDISLFQALFAFDMSSEEYEILRSSIPIRDELIEQMREYSGDLYEKEKVLAFLNYHHSSNAPLLKVNPTVLSPASLAQLNKLTGTPINIFLSGKGEITMGDRIDIDHVTNVGGIQNVGKFAEQITSSLNTEGQRELAEALKSLIEAIAGSRHMTEVQKQEQIEVVSQIAEETVKPKPNFTLLKILGDGLILALKAVPDVAKAVAILGPLLAKLQGGALA